MLNIETSLVAVFISSISLSIYVWRKNRFGLKISGYGVVQSVRKSPNGEYCAKIGVYDISKAGYYHHPSGQYLRSGDAAKVIYRKKGNKIEILNLERLS